LEKYVIGGVLFEGNLVPGPFLSPSLFLGHHEVATLLHHTVAIMMFCLTTGPQQWSKLTMD
jgi:hypothetical protein